MGDYRLRTLSQIALMLSAIEAPETTLDFGSGDGWFASKISHLLPGSSITTIDVKRRDFVHVEPSLYVQGDPLPYPDGSFDLAYAIDVLHHCDEPTRYVFELSRVARRYILIKDHTYNTSIDRLKLAVLDELGNRRFGIPSPQNYQRGWDWTDYLHSLGWKTRATIYPCPCHVGLLGALTNKLQYLALYERSENPLPELLKVQSL